MRDVVISQNIYSHLVRGILMLSIIFSGTYRIIYQIIQEGSHLMQLVYPYMGRYSTEAHRSWRIGRFFTQMQKRIIRGTS